jgi:tetratricopeptide (TPR) repeat protein
MADQLWPPARLREALRRSPVTVPALGAIALFVIWASSDAGYPVTHWAPGGLILLGLLAITLFTVPLRLGEVGVALRVAVACLALYTALSYLSILWAHVPGDAWEGANRTLLYLLVFSLFALWAQRGATAALLLCVWALAMIVLAAFVLLHVNGAANPAHLFAEGRLKYPGDYENAAAATWCMAMWPALLLAASDRIPWALRGVLAGGTVLLGDLALLSQSRGSLYATVVMLILVFALIPGRVRTLVVLVPVAIGIGVGTPTLLHVGDRLTGGGDVRSALHAATAVSFAGAIAVGLIVAAGAALEHRTELGEETVTRISRGIGAIAIAGLIALIAGGWVAAGNPVARVEHAWHTFKGGYQADNAKVNRLVSGLGSGRYDFYRVALNEFSAHPILGIGADNFAEQYLAHAREGETPHYPHSVEIRTLVQTGIIGTLLALVGLAAALLAGGGAALSSAARRSDPLGATVAAAALAGFAYWVVHGSFDWFWEFAGLGAPAFALLGLACSLGRSRGAWDAPAPSDAAAGFDPGIPSETATGPSPRRSSARWLLIAAGAIVALAAAVSLLTPWLSELQVQQAARIWPTAPRRAYSDLNEAARLNPLSDESYLLAGSIALRFNDLQRADHEFALALGRDHGDVYATLERGAIASARGDRREALRLIERTVRLNPQDELLHEVLAYVRSGRRVNIDQLNRAILLKAQQLA